MAKKIPAIFLEINEDGIEEIRVAAERGPKHQREATKFYADLTSAINRLDQEIKRRKQQCQRPERI